MKFRKSLSVMLAAAMLTAAVPSAVMAESSVAENAEVMSDIELLPEADAESGAESVADREALLPSTVLFVRTTPFWELVLSATEITPLLTEMFDPIFTPPS